MKKFNFKFYLILSIFINSSIIKSDISINDFDLNDVLNSGRNLMSIDNDLHYLEAKSESQNTLFIAVHGSDSQGYEWIYPLIVLDSSENLVSFFRYNDNLCPENIYLKLLKEISSAIETNNNIKKVILMGHSYGAMIVAMFPERWINDVELIVHSVAGPLTGPISSSLKSSLFSKICDYSPPKSIRDNVDFFQWRTIKELDGAFNELKYDPQIIDLEGSTVVRLPDTYNGRRLGHKWSLSWVSEQLVD